MDNAYYEEVRGSLRGLLIRLESRLDRRTVNFVAEELDAYELGLALEAMADALSERHQPLDPDERADMLSLAKRMQMDDAVPLALSQCPNR